MRSDTPLYLMLASAGGLLVFILTTDWPRHGTLSLRHAACSFAKSAGITPATTDTGCTLEGKYDIGWSFTEVRLPNKQKLLISNAEISGIVRK
ncbi:MAG: hypothetical protein HOO95_02100 [Gallionella sp.]|nr:hypothetical protein [Gallionella sp.]